MNKKELVSVIIPVYNASSFLMDTIKTIQKQTYENWEAIFVDDCSKDNSVEIIKKEQKKDERIKLVKNKENSGAAVSRNNGIDIATGKYLCFLDADDKWHKDKLSKQVKFMKEKKCEFSFTGYEFADENCVPNGKKVNVPNKINYKQALKNTTIWTSTVMFDMEKLTKEEIYMPNVKSEDTALWWRLLRTKIENAYGLNEILSYYRRSSGTLSSNKFKAIKRIWNLYRKNEGLNIFKSIYYSLFWAFNAVRRRV